MDSEVTQNTVGLYSKSNSSKKLKQIFQVHKIQNLTNMKKNNKKTEHHLTIQIDVADAAFNHTGNSLSRVLWNK